MLVKLAESLEIKTLKFFWHTEMNLYQTLKNDQLVNMEGQVKRIIAKTNRLLEANDVEKIKTNIFQIFGVDMIEEDIKKLVKEMSGLSTIDRAE